MGNIDLNTEISIEKDSIIMLTLAILITGTALILINRIVKKK